MSNYKFLNEPVDVLLDSAGNGISANMGAKDVLKIGGVKYTKPALLSRIEKMKRRYKAVAQHRQELEDLLAERNQAEPEVQEFLRDLAASIRTEHGSSAAVHARFGIPMPKQRRELSPEQKVVKAARAQETRKLRGTQGKRQRSKVKAEGPREVNVAAPQTPNPAPPANPPAPVKAAPVSNGAVNVIAAPADPALAKPALTNGVEH